MGLRQFSFTKGAIYIAVQILGSIFAALLILIIIPYKFEGEGVTSIEFPNIPKSIPTYCSFIMQFIGSGFYVWTYYALIVDCRAPSNIFGFAIGGVSILCDLCFGEMVGGCINPVKYIGPRLVTAELSEPWVYFTAPLLGGIFAGFYFDFFVLERKEKEELFDEDDDDQFLTTDPSPEDKNDFGTLINTNRNSLKNMLFTKNNSEKDIDADDKKEDDLRESKEQSHLQSQSSLSNI